MKVLITNTIVMNAGVAAMVDTVATLVRDRFGPDAECIVYEQTPEIGRRLYPHLRFRRLLYYHVSHAPRVPFIGGAIGAMNRARFKLAARMWAAGRQTLVKLFTTPGERFDLEQYSTADVIVSGGGTYLVDNYDLSPRIYDYEIVRIMNKPLVFFTQSLGPLEKPANRDRLKPIFEYASLLLLRDDASLNHLRRMPVHNPNVHLSADTVFMMTNGRMEERAATTSRSNQRQRRAAISVRNWPYFKTIDSETGMKRYRAAIAAAVKHLVTTHNFDVTFISTCQGIDQYWFDDSHVAGQIAEMLDPATRERVSVDAMHRTPAQMVETLEPYDLVIATRFHMAILALVAGVPTVGISYEFKTTELFAGLGIADWEIDLETVAADELCERIDRCLAADQRRLSELSSVLERERKRVDEAGQLLLNVVNAA